MKSAAAREARRGSERPSNSAHSFGLLPCLLAAALGCVSLPPPMSPALDAQAPDTLRRGADAGEAYRLPYPAGERHLCVQAVSGPFGHSEATEYAFDFRMEPGSTVVAARAGTVVAVKSDSLRGGPGRPNLGHANFVRVEHADGTRASYLHLAVAGVLVEVGQRVERGQPIARSGDTGRSSFPHLHFHVTAWDPASRRRLAVPVRFEDVDGSGVPRALVVYESGNARDPSEPARH